MSITGSPTWRTTLSALPILALLLALTLAPALAQEEVTGNYYTIKYHQDGSQLWQAIYDGGGWDYAYGVAVDSEGNVIVTGASEIDNYDYCTIKYDPNGNELWRKTYSSMNTFSDEAVGQGNGSKTEFNLAHRPLVPQSETIYFDDVPTDTNYDIDHESGKITFNKAPQDGVTITADYAAYGRDEAYGVAVDSQDNIIVTGHSSDGKTTNYCTIKYDPDGNELGPNPVIYNSGYRDGSNSVAVDSQDNVIVTGFKGTWYDYNGNDEEDSQELGADFLTIKYHPDGSELWQATYGSWYTYLDEALGSGDDAETKFTLSHPPIVPQSETVYLDGEAQLRDTDYAVTQAYDASAGSWTSTITFYTAPAAGTAITADYIWASNDGALEVAIDSADNIIATGASERWHDYNQNGKEDEEEVNRDYCTIKYDKDGNELWDEPLFYDSQHPDSTYGVAVDSQDNIVVSGSYYTQPEAEPGAIVFPQWHTFNTIKYTPEGEKIWQETYDLDEQENVYDVAVDYEDNVIVTGKVSDGETFNYRTIKYDKDGHQLWNRGYDGGQFDSALDVAIDAEDNVIVTGTSQRDPAADEAAGGGLSSAAILGIAMGGCAAIILAYLYLVYFREREKSLPRGERRRRAAKQRKQTKR